MMSGLRVPLGFGIAAFVFYVSTPASASMIAGFPVALVGLVFRALAAGVIQKDSVLAQIGPYRLTRNPLYFGSFLLVVGFGVMSGSIAAAAILIFPFVLIYRVVIKQEEQHLEQIFGEEFMQFRTMVPQFFPRRLDRSILESFSLSQYLANREYNAGAGFVGATIVLFVKMLVAPS